MAKNEVATMFYRKGRLILDTLGNISQEFKSINQAKRWSRDEQKANGGLGMRYVQIRRVN